MPVAEVLAGLFSEGPLAELGPEALYVDADPHGTPTTYLLAAMVSYAALYGEAPPVGLDMGEEVAPELRRAYPLVALEIAARPDSAGKRIVVIVPDAGERYLSTALCAQLKEEVPA